MQIHPTSVAFKREKKEKKKVLIKLARRSSQDRHKKKTRILVECQESFFIPTQSSLFDTFRIILFKKSVSVDTKKRKPFHFVKTKQLSDHGRKQQGEKFQERMMNNT